MIPVLINVPEKVETDRLILRVPQACDGSQLYEAIMDGYDDGVRWLNWSSIPPTKEAVEIECRSHHARFILREDIRYLLVDKKSNRVVGRCGFPPFQAVWTIPQFGISYFVRRSVGGQGVGTEAAHALSLVAFQVLEAQKVEIYTDEENIASRRIPEKLNFKLECKKKGGWPRPEGKLANLCTFSLFSPSDLPQGFSFKIL